MMKKSAIIFVLIYLVGITNSSSGQYLKPTVIEVVTEFDVYPWLDPEVENNSHQNICFKELNDIATDNELVLLTDHVSEVTRSYAFKALVKRNSVELMPIILKHLNDKGYVNTWAGCMNSWESISDYFLQLVSSNPFTPNSYQLSDEQKSKIDSIIIFDRSTTAIRSKADILIRLNPDQKYYERIKEIFIHDSSNCALIALSRFKKFYDKHLIIEKLTSTVTDNIYYGLWAVRNYPDSSFFPYIKAIHKRQTQSGQTCYLIRMLYQTILQYRNQESKELLDLTCETVKLNTPKTLPKSMGVQSECHSKFMLLALEKYPDSIYQGYKDNLFMTKWDLFDISTLKNETDEILPYSY